ncbi:MAG TPA: DNA-binding protein [Nitrososphaerales archaeon]
MYEEGKNEKNSREEDEKKRAMREGIIRMIFTSEARERLTNVRLVKPDVAQVVEDNVIRLVSAGKVKPPVSDEDVKRLLMSFQQPKREFKIKWA